MTKDFVITDRSLEYGPPPENTDRDNIESRQKICALENFPAYFLQYVFIIEELVGFRLAVIHQDEVKTNEFFPTLKAAKKAFADKYNKKAWEKSVIPRWTDLYAPDNDWLIDKQILLKNDMKRVIIEQDRRKAAQRKFRIRIGKMSKLLQTFFLYNAREFGLEYFTVVKSSERIFFVCITKEPKPIMEKVQSIDEALDYFNEHFGKRAKPPVNIIQQWLWLNFERKQEVQADRSGPDGAVSVESTSLKEAFGKFSDFTEVVFL
ncbi:MAG TPA: hypothetical protein VF870_07350 [Ignavibacteriaceae bacterium]